MDIKNKKSFNDFHSYMKIWVLTLCINIIPQCLIYCYALHYSALQAIELFFGSNLMSYLNLTLAMTLLIQFALQDHLNPRLEIVVILVAFVVISCSLSCMYNFIGERDKEIISLSADPTILWDNIKWFIAVLLVTLIGNYNYNVHNAIVEAKNNE